MNLIDILFKNVKDYTYYDGENILPLNDRLLKKVEYNKSEILCALRINGMSRSVIALLKKSLRLINEKQEKATCFC